uniref:Uncharacterized protein n=1 Tax=Anguilla anguilla TaxID=7936 RepID=A0A0E9RVQ0_ANGAN
MSSQAGFFSPTHFDRLSLSNVCSWGYHLGLKCHERISRVKYMEAAILCQERVFENIYSADIAVRVTLPPPHFSLRGRLDRCLFISNLSHKLLRPFSL